MVILGKSGQIKPTPFAQPILAQIRLTQGVLDEVASLVMGEDDFGGSVEAAKSRERLDKDLEDAIAAFES